MADKHAQIDCSSKLNPPPYLFTEIVDLIKLKSVSSQVNQNVQYRIVSIAFIQTCILWLVSIKS